MIDCPECRMEERIKQLEEKDRHNSSEHSKFYDRFGSIGLDNQKHDLEIRNISEKLDKIDDSLEEMKDKPSKNIDKFSGAIISAIGSLIGTGIVGMILYSILAGLP